MKILKLSDVEKKNSERRESAIRAVRSVDPEFVPGKRDFDRPRKNKHKQKILEEMEKRESGYSIDKV